MTGVSIPTEVRAVVERIAGQADAALAGTGHPAAIATEDGYCVAGSLALVARILRGAGLDVQARLVEQHDRRLGPIYRGSSFRFTDSMLAGAKLIMRYFSP